MSNNELDSLVATLKTSFGGNEHERRQALNRFEEAKHDPQFSSMLCQIFGADHLDAPTRMLAGLTLKNNIESARKKLGEHIFLEAGKAALNALDGAGQDNNNNNNSNNNSQQNQNNNNNQQNSKVLANTGAMIMTRITSETGLDWWKANLNCDLGNFLIEDMLRSENATRAHVGVLALQYLVEDASQQLGDNCGNIIQAVADFAIQRWEQKELADRALATLCNIYDFGSKLDWYVENFSPVQRGLMGSAQDAMKCGVGYYMQPSVNILEQEGRTETRRYCLRLLSLLVKYFLNPADDNHSACTDIANVGCRVFCSGIMSAEREVAIEAGEVLVQLFFQNEATSEQGGPSVVIDIVGAGLDQVLETIYKGLNINRVDVESALEHDNPSNRDVFRTEQGGLGKRNKTQDVADQNPDEDDFSDNILQNPLRSVNYRLLSCMAASAISTPVYENARAFAEQRFTSQQSGPFDKIVALDVLCAIHDGCGKDMESFIVALSKNLIEIIEASSSNHVALTAVTLHTLGKFFVDLIRLNQSDAANRSFELALMAMQHPQSKYVQYSAVSATRQIIMSCTFCNCTDLIRHHMQTLCETIGTCLNNYHTNNFALLTDFCPLIVPLLDQDGVNFFVNLLVDVCKSRHTNLVGSLGAKYFENQLNVEVQKEFFDVLHSLLRVWETLYPFPENFVPLVSELLGVLVSYMSNLLDSFTPIVDDATLMDAPLEILRKFYPHVGQYKQQLCPALQDVPAMLMVAFKRCQTDFRLRSLCLGNLHDILLTEPSLVNEDVLNKLLLAINDVYAGDNPNQDTCMFQGLQGDAALALYAMSQMDNLPFDISATMTSVAAAVRGDFYDEESPMGTIAQCCGIFMLKNPRIFQASEAESVICALRYAAKDAYGAQAYMGVCNFVAELAQHNAQEARPLLEDLANLIVSWTTALPSFEDVKPAVVAVLNACPPLADMIPPSSIQPYR